MKQLKMTMLSSAEMEHYARAGATHLIVEERKNHAAIDRELPGVLAAAIRQLRADGVRNRRAPVEAEPPKPRRTMSASARKRISEAQKARWAKQKKTARKAG